MRILIADNDSEQRMQLVELCKRWGHTTQEALTMRDVLEICRKKCPDLCLIDINVSGVSGIEIVKQVRQLGGVAVWNPLVLMAKHPTPQQGREGVAAGADDFLAKPIDPIQLEYKIASAKRHEDMKDEVFSVAHDLVLANRALEDIVTQDVMTGIADVSKFHKDLEIEWYKAKKDNTTLAMIIFDLDDFREFNNLYGTAKGDGVIKQVSGEIKKILPKECKTFARTINVTFGLLLPAVSGEKAQQIGEMIRDCVEKLKIENKGSHCGAVLTASIGVTATVQDNFKNPLDLMESADYALYQAKHKGKNRVVYEPAAAHES